MPTSAGKAKRQRQIRGQRKARYGLEGGRHWCAPVHWPPKGQEGCPKHKTRADAELDCKGHFRRASFSRRLSRSGRAHPKRNCAQRETRRSVAGSASVCRSRRGFPWRRAHLPAKSVADMTLGPARGLEHSAQRVAADAIASCPSRGRDRRPAPWRAVVQHRPAHQLDRLLRAMCECRAYFPQKRRLKIPQFWGGSAVIRGHAPG